MRITRAIRVRPGASTTRVGGAHGDGPDRSLVVRVTAPAVDGRATEAAVRALADALALPPGAVTLRRGTTSRSKVVVIEVAEGDAQGVTARWQDLMGQSGSTSSPG